MKSKLLLSTLLLSFAAFAQEPITFFYNFTGSNQAGTEEGDVYSLVTSSVNLNEATAGANQVWNFNQLTSIGTTTTKVKVPTAAQVEEFPNTSAIVETATFPNTGGGNVTKYYLGQALTGAVSVTGAETSSIILNYSTTNALIGNFPLDFEDTVTGPVAGNFEAQGIEGTFTGTGVSTFDAYGTLTVNEGVANATPVSRIKTTQNITLNYLGFPAGTVVQTIYSYYNATTVATGPIFRSITTTINVPAMSIDQTVSSLESYLGQLLSTDKPALGAVFSIVPNPVGNVLQFSGNAIIKSVTITDVSGKVVLNTNASNNIDVSGLNTDVYFVAAQTETGITVQKMVKK